MSNAIARTRTVTLSMLGLAGLLTFASIASSQPGDRDRDRGSDRTAHSSDREPAAGLQFAESDLRLDLIEGDPTSSEYRSEVRAALWAQIVALRAEEERIRRAIRALDQGEPLADVRSVRNAPRPKHPVEDLKRALGPMLGALANEVEASTFENGDFSDNQIDEIEEFLREHNPEAADRFSAQRELGTSLFTDLLDRHGQKILRLAHEKQRDPDLFEARIKSADIERKIRRAAFIAVSAESERASTAQDRLRELINEQFEIRLEVEGLETQRLADAIDERMGLLEAREQDRDRLVEARLQEILAFARDRAGQMRERLGNRRGQRPPRVPEPRP